MSEDALKSLAIYQIDERFATHRDLNQIAGLAVHLQAENQRLRSALESIVGRGTRKGPGAAVVVSMSTLVAIARQALEVSDE